MNQHQVLAAYQAATGAKNMHVGRVKVALETGQVITDYRALEALVKAFPLQAGWLCYQSKVVRLSADETLPEEQDGKILYGELAGKRGTEKAGSSLHIQGQGNQWWLTHIQENAGDSCLVKVEKYCISEVEKACYHVFWKQGDSGYQPESYRFVGFSATEKGGQ